MADVVRLIWCLLWLSQTESQQLDIFAFDGAQLCWAFCCYSYAWDTFHLGAYSLLGPTLDLLSQRSLPFSKILGNLIQLNRSEVLQDTDCFGFLATQPCGILSSPSLGLDPCSQQWGVQSPNPPASREFSGHWLLSLVAHWRHLGNFKDTSAWIHL